jgi:hypothetical protein
MCAVPDVPRGLPEFTLDGSSFHDLAGFFEAVSNTLGTKGCEKDLDAFNDILRGGFGTPDEGFVLRWTNSKLSAERLGWDETIRFLQRKLSTSHTDNVSYVQQDLEAARRHEGQTLYDIILEIIGVHSPGGREGQDNVHLVVE